MTVHLHRPPPPLAAFIDCLWEQVGAAPSHALERNVPSGTSELVIGLGPTPLRVGRGDAAPAPVAAAALCGVQSAPFLIDPRAPEIVLGVHFRPGGAFAFFAAPAAARRGSMRSGAPPD